MFVGAAAFAADSSPDPLAALDPIAASKSEVDLGSTALIIARAVNPVIDVGEYSERLDALASELKPALAINPAEAETHIELALAYQERGETRKAAEHARAAASLGTKIPESLRPLFDLTGTK